MDPDELSDRMSLRDLVGNYARGVDRRDFDGVAALFTEDGVLQSPAGGSSRLRERKGRGQIALAMRGVERYLATTHLVGQHFAEIDGDTAEGETYCLAHHIFETDEGGDRQNYVMSIRYMDSYERVEGSWLFARRRLEVDWTETRPVGPRSGLL